MLGEVDISRLVFRPRYTAIYSSGGLLRASFWDSGGTNQPPPIHIGANTTYLLPPCLTVKWQTAGARDEDKEEYTVYFKPRHQ